MEKKKSILSRLTTGTNRGALAGTLYLDVDPSFHPRGGGRTRARLSLETNANAINTGTTNDQSAKFPSENGKSKRKSEKSLQYLFKAGYTSFFFFYLCISESESQNTLFYICKMSDENIYFKILILFQFSKGGGGCPNNSICRELNSQDLQKFIYLFFFWCFLQRFQSVSDRPIPINNFNVYVAHGHSMRDSIFVRTYTRDAARRYLACNNNARPSAAF